MAEIWSADTTGLTSMSVLAGEAVHDAALVVLGRVGDLALEHEAVDLRLGQGIGAFLLDRVLGGHDQERLGQAVGVVADGDLVLLHGLEQGRLHLGRRAVDLVGQEQVGEDRALAWA